MNKKISLGAAVSFMAIIAIITFTLTMFFSTNIFNSLVGDVKNRELLYKKVSEVDALVRQNYDGTIDEDALLESISKGYVNGIDDKYAAYLSADQLKYENDENNGVVVGIGVITEQDASGYIKITDVIDNSPAQAAKFKKGDLIVKVGSADVVATGYEKSMRLIKGNAGTKVKLTIRRNGKDLKQTELIRKNVELPSVEYRVIGTNGYIKINTFNASTVKQFETALTKLKKQGVKALIFDLRNNGGGTLDSVSKILDTLLPEGDIVIATYKDKSTEVLAASDEREENLPMVTIVNGSTASASELFVSSLKDYNKAESVGVKTYGKGVMQTTYTLSDGSGIRITTAHFTSVGRKDFNGVGIEPDYQVALTKEQEESFSSLNETNDPQLIKAIEIANAKQE